MPTINKPFLLKLVLVLAAVAGALFGVHAIQAGRIPDALRRQADRAADAGKTDAAIHYLRQYLEFKPDDVDIQVRLVELLRKRNPTPRGQADTIFLYDKILRLDPDRHPVRRDALAVCLKLGRYSDAVTHAEVLLKAFPTEADLWQQLGAAQAGLNLLTEARKSYETAIAHSPHDMLGHQRLAQLLWRNLHDPVAARAALDRMVAATPQVPDVYLVRAKFETFLADEPGAGAGTVGGDLKKAAADLQRVLELDPEQAEASVLLAELLQRERNVPGAHAILRDALSLYPRDLRLVRSLSWLELVRGNAPAAIGILEDGLRASPDGFELLVPLADLLVQQGDTARTAEILRRLEGRKPPRAGRTGAADEGRDTHDLQVKYLKARIAMRDGKWPEATALLEALRARATSLPGLEAQLNLLLSVCARQVADPAAEERAYQRVVSADPKNVQARAGLGNLYLNLGRFDDATRELDAAAQSPYATGPVVAQWVRAKAHRLRLAPGGGSPEEWRKLEAAAVAAAGRFGPVSSEPVILHAEVAVAGGRAEEAVKFLRKEAARRPGDARLWAVLAATVADVSGTAAGLAVVDEAQAAAGDNPDVRLARAKLYAGEPGRVRPVAPLADQIESWPEGEQLRLLYGLVEVFDHAGDEAGVIAMLRRVAARRPTDAAVWVRLHERALRARDAKAAAEARATLVRLEGEAGSGVLLCDAAAAAPAECAKVIDRLTALHGANPTRADVCLALARLYRTAGLDRDAARFAERAFDLDPTRYDAARAWLSHLCGVGSDDKARQLLARLAADVRWAGDPFRRVVASVVPAVPPATAANLLAWTRAHVERDPGGLGWLAETAAAHRVSDPLPLLQEAAKRPGATADDWLRLALARHPKDPAGAAEALRAAKAKLAPPAYASVVAVFAETAGSPPPDPDAPDARLVAQARLAVKLSRGKPDEAMKVLEAYLAAKDLGAPEAAWARRNLAMLYAVGGTPEDRQKATDLIKSTTDFGTAPDELRSTASVLTTLARYLEGADRVAVLTRAAAALDAAHKATNSPKDLYNLSQLHRAAGNRAESRRCLQILLNADARNMYYLVAAVEELVEDQNFDAAGAFAARLTAEHPGEFRAVAAVARFECRAGRPGNALAAADKYAQAAGPSAGDHLTRAGRVAELLDELARLPNVRGTPAGKRITDAAVERYASLVPTRAEAVTGMAGVLAADGRSAEAFATIDQYAKYIPARTKAAAGLAVVRAGAASDRQAETVNRWLDACLAEDPAAVELLLSKAEFLALRQDLAGAAAEYEKVVAAQPRNVVALNNLAWILAADPRTAERALALVARATREIGLTGDLLDTRARVRITLKQFQEAERDLNDAIRLESTPLRWFHLALSRLGQTPARTDDAAKAFREAKRRGLDHKGVHPADLPTFRVLDAGNKTGS